jgi:uncharacterized protein YjbI with pentapeptide repeats
VAAATALSLFLASAILIGVDAWYPVARYFGDYRDHWRIWIVVAACVLAVTGAVVAFRRPGVPGRSRAARSRMAAQPSGPQARGWMAAAVATVPGLVAVVGLVFTALTVRANEGQLTATQQQLTVTELGQITDRYNAAVANLGNDGDIDIRLGGLYALQHVMQDYPPYQSTVVAVLSAFVREKGASRSADAAPAPDVQAALTVVGSRNVKKDTDTTVVDFNHALLADAQMESLRFGRADVAGATLAGADLDKADLNHADLDGADLTGANLDASTLAGANLTGANLTMATTTDADLANANLSHANLSSTVLDGVSLKGASFAAANLNGAVLAGEDATGVYFGTANLTEADLSGAVLRNAYLVAAEVKDGKLVNADLTGADLTGADLTGADLRYADLTDASLSYADLSRVIGIAADLPGANLTGADLAGAVLTGYAANLTNDNLTNADLTNANLTNANLTGVTLDATKLEGANLTNALWPRGVAPPPGWQRKPGSGRLQAAGT